MRGNTDSSNSTEYSRISGFRKCGRIQCRIMENNDCKKLSYKCFIKEIMFGVLDLNVMFGMVYSRVRTGFAMGFKNPSIPSRSRIEIAFSLLFFQGRIY